MSQNQLNKDDKFDYLDYKELEPCKFSFDSSSISTFNEFFGVNSFRILDETFIRLIDNDDLYKEGFQLKDESLENNLVEVIVKKEKTEVKFVASNSYPICHCGIVVKNQFIINGKIYEYMLVHLVGRMNNIDMDKSMIKCHFTKTFKQCQNALIISTPNIRPDKISKTLIQKSDWIEISSFTTSFSMLIRSSIGNDFEYFYGVESNTKEINKKFFKATNDLKFIEKFANYYGIDVPTQFREKIANFYIELNPALEIFRKNLHDFYRAMVDHDGPIISNGTL